MERQYAPLPKRFGTAFLPASPCAGRLLLFLRCRPALRAETWPEREEALCGGYEIVAEMHNALGITELPSRRRSGFYGRPSGDPPARPVRGEDRCRSRIRGARRLAEGLLIGGIDLISDNTDLLARPATRSDLRKLYRTPELPRPLSERSSFLRLNVSRGLRRPSFPLEDLMKDIDNFGLT